MSTTSHPGIKLVVFDWTGTLIDHGSVARVAALQQAFATQGLSVSKSQARGLMALRKLDLIEALLRVPAVQRQFHKQHRRAPSSADADALYEAFRRAQLTAAGEHSVVIEGALTACAHLRERGIAIATVCSEPRALADVLRERARDQGLVPSHSVCADDVPLDQPAPHMIYACMQALGVQRPRDVLVVGDMPLDVTSARNAGCWSTGVAGTGNEVGLPQRAWDELTFPARNAALANAHRTLRDAGADFVIDTLSELPLVIRRIRERSLSSAA